MKYIKIRGSNYNEVMMKLKMEHGDDAIPISHKFVKEGGFFKSKLFAKEVVELTAAVQERKLKSSLKPKKRNIDLTVGDGDTNRVPGVEKPESQGHKRAREDRASSISTLNERIDTLNDSLTAFNSSGNAREPRAERQAEAPTAVEPRPDTPVPDAPVADVQTSRFEKELSEIKDALKKITAGNMKVAEGMPPAEEENIKPFRDMLKYNDYDDEQCNLIIGEVKNSISKDDLKDKYKIEKSLKDLLKSKIVTTGPIIRGARKKVIMFVGPTGVGKTTTMAKLGAINSLREGNKVVFITIDNYRIAATEQLKKYAEIMSIPVHAVNSPKEFKEIISSEGNEIIMVDTSGRSHRNEMKISEIKDFAALVECDLQKVLCVSANTKKSDLNEVFRAFNSMNFDSVVITKVDETSYVGNVVDIADKYNKPISYVTNGQEVPNDIDVADPDKIVDMMIGNVIV